MIIRRPCDFLRKGFIRQHDESNFKPESLSIIYHITGFGTIKNTRSEDKKRQQIGKKRKFVYHVIMKDRSAKEADDRRNE